MILWISLCSEAKLLHRWRKKLMNKQLGVVARRGLLAIAGMIVYSGSAWAATNSCPNTTASSSVSNGVNNKTVTIPGAGGGSPANDLASLGSGGCTAVDLSFSNFNNSTFTGAGADGIETAAGTYMAETPAGTGDNPLTNPDTLLFATVRGAADIDTDGDNNDGNNNWVGIKDAGVTDDITYNVAGAVVNNILLTVYQPHIDSGATGSITVDICEGAAPNTQITTLLACTAAGGTSFVTSTLALSTKSGTLTLNVPLAAFPNAFDITTEIDLDATGTNKVAGFDAFSEEFDEGAPEPSTFVLLGTALAAVGLLRLRARRIRSNRLGIQPLS